MEPARSRSRRARRAVQHGRLLHSVRENESRAGEESRSAAVDRGAVREPARVSEEGRDGGAEAGGRRLRAGVGRAEAGRAGRRGVGLDDAVNVLQVSAYIAYFDSNLQPKHAFRRIAAEIEPILL